MNRIGVALLATLGVVGCGSSSPTDASRDFPPTSAQDGSSSSEAVAANIPFRKILCFGDSITYGVTLEALSLPPGAQADLSLVEGYVPKLWRLLESKYGSGFDLINAGVPGERTTEGVERLRTELRVFEPDLVLLLEGIVDVNGSSPRFPVVRENLVDMMGLVKREGALVIIGTYPLLNPDGYRTAGAQNVPRLNDVIRQEANRLSVPVADHELANELAGQGPDGLHPNNIGYETMAGTWLAAIEALAETLGET
ncbi:MAG TPA: SGNH/GDSL hydrolase family protein [Vicinamibacteria bacterium]|nr:SGNH/GDSL hydrolase family protein [Vicinamibacteria bacterium]